MSDLVEDFLSERFGIELPEDGSLKHYASKYYDPVKAREYYLRTRELKGREPQLSKESRERQRQATAYVSNEIKTKRTADLAANKADRDKLGAAAKAQAEAHKARMEKLQKDVTAQREKVVAKLKAHIEDIKSQLKIPENASPKLRAFLEKQQARRTQTAAGKAQSELDSLRTSFRSALDTARNDYRSFRTQNTTARRDNATKRRQIVDTYRKDLETEKQNIKDQVR